MGDERTVRNIMSRHLLYLSEGQRPQIARKHLLAFAVTAVPVLDENHRPVGMVSLRDLDTGAHHVTRPAPSVRDDMPIEAAARALAESGLHHLVVVDADGRAVGMLSALDVLRALVGVEVSHPEPLARFRAAAPS